MYRHPPCPVSPYLRSPIAMAHRGGAAVWPENTVTSFEGAIALGYRYIETDLHVTRDGHIVSAQTWESHPELYREIFRCLRGAAQQVRNETATKL